MRRSLSLAIFILKTVEDGGTDKNRQKQGYHINGNEKKQRVEGTHSGESAIFHDLDIWFFKKGKS
ncbi:MAG: hypothetical protein ABS85_04625 [Sphingobacteriales bacterium SCN 48-20]|nr:MAG: hypothetical protein ABS85_04625 [Sphingobacteriales bacterium SCN 48-20]OJW44918.1 MAG: hypothetical protein BGO56_15840 [Sphingobacteriales bacterium 48-107]